MSTIAFLYLFTILNPNPLPLLAHKMQILTEEQYVDEIGKIIERDFFPDLQKLRAQHQYMEAMEQNDTLKLRELYAKFTGRRPTDRSGNIELHPLSLTSLTIYHSLSVSQSPATFETPLHPSSQSHHSTRSNKTTLSTTSSKSSVSKNHSLDSFLGSFTSEDNNSFNEIIEKADKKLKQKFSVLFEAEHTTAIEMAKSLALPSIGDQFAAIEGPKRVDMWTYKNKNSIMYVPDGVELTKAEQMEMAKNKQEVIHNNTRLTHKPWDEEKNKEAIALAAKNQSKGLSGKIGVDGNVIESTATPEIRGFRFERTPSPCPGVAESPLMTWGQIDGTPFRLDGGDTPLRPALAGPAFRIAEPSRRDEIGLKLAEKAGERMRGQKAKAMEAARRNIASPYIRSTLDRIASMSPAAKRLASGRVGGGILTPKMMTPKEALGNFTPGSSSSRRNRATPSPLVRRRKEPATPTILSGGGDRKETAAQSKPTISITSDLTSDLLNLPGQRNRASDFF